MIPSVDMAAGVRDLVGAALEGVPVPKKTIDAAVRRMDDQRDRARRLFEFGEYTWGEFMAKRDAHQSREEATGGGARPPHQPGAMEWCRAQVADLLQAWDDGKADQRTRLLGAIFERIEAVVEEGGGSARLPCREPIGGPSSRVGLSSGEGGFSRKSGPRWECADRLPAGGLRWRPLGQASLAAISILERRRIDNPL
jgi:hypothetical protein